MTPHPLENRVHQDISRRGFLHKTSLASLGLIVPGREPLLVNVAGKTSDDAGNEPTGAGDLPSGGHPIKLFCCDLNWVRLDKPVRGTPPAAPREWAFAAGVTVSRLRPALLRKLLVIWLGEV